MDVRSGVFVHVRINAARGRQGTWGDTQYAEGLIRAIRTLPGCDATLLLRGETPAQVDRPAVVVQIVGPHLEEPVQGMANILWMISPPNVAPLGMLNRYQAVFCASQYLAARLSDRGVATVYLPQATEPEHFHPDRRPPGVTEAPLVFVGGLASRVDRWIVQAAIDAGFEPQIWGPGWQGVAPDRLWRGERLDYAELAATYATARVVLNSHMAGMAQMGFMSNRSQDALSSGAAVISDQVRGFSDPDLPELRQVPDTAGLVAALEQILGTPSADRATRIALHDRVVARHGFNQRARVILDCARGLLAQGRVSMPILLGGAGGGGRAGAPPTLTDPRVSAGNTRSAMLAAAQEITAIAGHLQQDPTSRLAPPASAVAQGVIHPLMADLRDVQQIALGADTAPGHLATLAARAHRVVEALSEAPQPLGFRGGGADADRAMVGVMHNRPLWAASPEGFARDDGKLSVPLWPRKEPPAMARPLGVFLHLYHDDLAPAFAERLAHVACPMQVHVSTDTEAKAARIRTHLPDAEVRVLENRGRDIWPKLYGFRAAHDRHDIVLHLHGKRSPHSDKLDDWLSHILDCLIGSPAEVNRILSFFGSVPRLGMVVPVTFRGVLGAAHWGANHDIARELAWRMALPDALPDDTDLRFPVGSMFWARTAAMQPLLDLALRPEHFPPEAGQVDGTLAHAIERMLGVTCRATGHHILPVVGAGSRLHLRHQWRVPSNRALRDALQEGLLNG